MTLRSFSPFVLVLACAAVLVVPACTEKKSAPASSGSAKSESQPAPTAKRVTVEVNATGYKPDTVMAKAGEPVTIVFTRVTDKGCGQKVLVPSEGIEKDLPLNTPVEVSFTPAKSGNIGFTCGMKMMKGTIMVH